LSKNTEAFVRGVCRSMTKDPSGEGDAKITDDALRFARSVYRSFQREQRNREWEDKPLTFGQRLALGAAWEIGFAERSEPTRKPDLGATRIAELFGVTDAYVKEAVAYWDSGFFTY